MLYSRYTVPEERGKGLGRALHIELARTRLAHQQTLTIHALVSPNDSTATSEYRKLDYVNSGKQLFSAWKLNPKPANQCSLADDS